MEVWFEESGFDRCAEPKTCGTGPFDDAFAIPSVSFELKNEAGELLDNVSLAPDAIAFRIPVGGVEIPVGPGTFGTVEVDALLFICPPFGAPCTGYPLQSWAASLMRASGRYSVGVPATRLDDPCL